MGCIHKIQLYSKFKLSHNILDTKKDKDGQFKLDNEVLFKTKKNIIQLVPIKLDLKVFTCDSKLELPEVFFCDLVRTIIYF
jgi:hypothetical protein